MKNLKNILLVLSIYSNSLNAMDEYDRQQQEAEWECSLTEEERNKIIHEDIERYNAEHQEEWQRESKETAFKCLKALQKGSPEKAKLIFEKRDIMYPKDLSLLVIPFTKLGDIETLVWLEEKGVLPNYQGANNAIFVKNRAVLDWLAERNIFPDDYGEVWLQQNPF